MEIFEKATENNLEYVKLHMTHLEMVDDKKKSLLHYAVTGSAKDVIDYLLNQDINVNLIDQYGETPLFDCARKGKVNIAKRLIDKFANVNIENNRGELPIHLASFKGDLEMIKLLIESGSMLNKKSNDDRLPLHYAIAGGRVNAIDFLVKQSNYHYNVRDTHGNTLLHHASKTSNVEMIDLLLKEGLDPNALNDHFETPLFNAVRFGTRETVHKLLTNDTYLDIKNRRFETVMDIASIFGKPDILDVLNAYIETPAYGRLIEQQALTIAVLNRDHIYLRKLIERHIPMKKDRRQQTALDYAKQYQLTLCVNMLKNLTAI